MGSHTPVTLEKIRDYRISEPAQACLAEQLTALLTGKAWAAIENHLSSPSLEIWRILAGVCDPRGGVLGAFGHSFGY